MLVTSGLQTDHLSTALVLVVQLQTEKTPLQNMYSLIAFIFHLSLRTPAYAKQTEFK